MLGMEIVINDLKSVKVWYNVSKIRGGNYIPENLHKSLGSAVKFRFYTNEQVSAVTR